MPESSAAHEKAYEILEIRNKSMLHHNLNYALFISMTDFTAVSVRQNNEAKGKAK